jgi:hypothetical protein
MEMDEYMHASIGYMCMSSPEVHAGMRNSAVGQSELVKPYQLVR